MATRESETRKGREKVIMWVRSYGPETVGHLTGWGPAVALAMADGNIEMPYDTATRTADAEELIEEWATLAERERVRDKVTRYRKMGHSILEVRRDLGLKQSVVTAALKGWPMPVMKACTVYTVEEKFRRQAKGR